MSETDRQLLIRGLEKAEYNMLRMQKYTKMYQQKCCEYQRAA